MQNLVRVRLPSQIRVALLCLIGVTMWAPQALADLLPDFDGQRVTAIRVVGESGAVLEDNPAGLALEPGQPFSIDAERETLRQLYRTGRYADLVAEVSPVGDGLLLSFVAQQNYYVSRVEILGLHEPPSDAQAASALGFSLGATFHEADMPTALARLRSMLEDEGLYQAKVSYQLSPRPDTRQLDITVRVVPGPRARAGALHLMNETPFAEADLRRRLRLKPKTELTSERLDQSTERARKWLAGRGYLGARVSVMRGSYDATTNELPLEIHLFAGLKVEVQVAGAKVSPRTLKRLLPIYEEGAVDDDLLQEGRRNLRDYFQGEGYFDTDVNYTTSETPAATPPEASVPATPETSAKPNASSETITYQVERGPRRRLVGIAFTGNHYFNDEILRSRVRIQPAAFDTPGRFSSVQLAGDVASLNDIYQANGFRSVHVNGEVQQNYGGKSEDLFVRFQVEEGPQTRVANLTLEGNKAISDAELLRVIGSAAGQPYSDFNVAGDRDNALALYYDQGFPGARFTSTVVEVPATGSQQAPGVALTYHVDEGAQLRVARVLVDGYDHTHLGVISREIQIQPGKPLSEGAVVETQRRLYNLEIFNRVSIAPQNPGGTDPNKTVDVLVEEARRYTIAYGPGLEVQRLGSPSAGPVSQPLRFSPRGTFEFTKLDLTGRADTLSFKARASTLQGRALLSYASPSFFGLPGWSWLLSGLFDKTRDVLTFTSTRGEGSAQLTDRLTPATSLLFRYVYRHVLASDLQVEPEEIPLFSQPTEVSFFSATWVRDRRDNAVDPTRGSFNTVDVDFASKALGSSSGFVRATAENSTFTRIGARLIFARSTRFGIQEPVEHTTATQIPLPERFFAGGGTTLRGFGLNQAGPRDPATGFPIGGLGLLVFNQQLQFPMHLPFVGNRVSGAIFYDAGNVFSSVGQFTFGSAPVTPVFAAGQPNICAINCNNALNYFSHTVGFEFRYHTPIGPVSIDLAYQLNAPQFLIPVGNTATCTNSAATTCLTLSRLPAFQFFVNLGSTF
jgi:outer membrane protein insertion porin family